MKIQEDNPLLNAKDIKVADEVWVLTALLHLEHPERSDFSVQEIVDRAKTKPITDVLRPGVYVHAVQHCVANRPPQGGRYRMLFETAPGRRRLFRPGDPSDPSRTGSKAAPRPGDLPERYRDLLEWYERRYISRDGLSDQSDPILGLRGLGKELQSDESPDDYVRRLRENWS